MYDELVERLRAGRYTVEELSIIIPKAANAIEELSMKRHGDLAAIAGMKREIERMVVTGTPRWIPTTERLPEHGWYLAYGPTIVMEVLHFSSVEEVWSSERYYNIEVTHWMPLPEPPKEER